MAFASSIKEDKLKFLEDVECYEDLDSRMVSMVPGRSNSSKWIRIIIEDRHSNKKNESKEGSKIIPTDSIDAKKDVFSAINTNDTKRKEEMVKEMAKLHKEVTGWQKVNNMLLLKL